LSFKLRGELKQAGVGSAAAVLIDATLIRGVLLAATIGRLDDWNWYLPTLALAPGIGAGIEERG
jgi:uncharacterized membrane protein YdfJ with MMPL/SSD domain